MATQDDTREVAAAFAPYRSILARYLWRIKDTAVMVPASAPRPEPRPVTGNRVTDGRGSAIRRRRPGP